jgi:alpha-beta hydrolase superfamily lysophospholipase
MSSNHVSWEPDVLGSGFEQTTLPLGTDGEGLVVATLVKYTAPIEPGWIDRLFGRGKHLAANTDVLYVHGWADYFFQRHLAEYWRSQGAHFYALDLRKFGRSIRPHQTPGFIEDLNTYDEDIEAALDVMGHGRGQRNGRKLVLMGHSMGGLIFSLWQAHHPARADALVLNAPWLEYQLTSTVRRAAAPVIGLQAKVRPKSQMVNIDFGLYNRATSINRDGEWEFNESWRPAGGFGVRSAWMNAILAGHAEVARGLDITVPVLTLLSDKSLLIPTWRKEMMYCDIAIDVDIVAARCRNLGDTVTIARIRRAMHDVFLSKQPARAQSFDAISRWMKAYL